MLVSRIYEDLLRYISVEVRSSKSISKSNEMRIPSFFAIFLSLASFLGIYCNGDATLDLQSERRVISKLDCDLSVCFAIDGSNTIPPWVFQAEKSIVKNVVHFLSLPSGKRSYAAVQYGISNHAVSSLNFDEENFLELVATSSQFRDARSFVTAGLNYCFSELEDVRNYQKKIVFLGNGRSTIGSDPGERADLFSSIGGETFAVGVGKNQNTTVLRNIARGKASRVFSLGNSDNIWSISMKLATRLCA